MAIPVARVHLAMAHAALPGLLPTPPRCMMLLPPLLPPPPCAVILPNNSPPRPSRADAADRWDAGKTKVTKPAGGSPASSCSGSQSSMGRKSSSPGRASSCESRVGNDSKNKSTAGAAAASSSSSCSSSCLSFSSYGSCSDDSEYEESLGASSSSVAASSYYRTQTRHISRRPTTNADSDERWDAHKKPAASPAAPAAAASASGNRTKARRPNNSRASPASAERWDAHKQLQPRAPPPPAELELDDGESSTGSNEVELDMPWRRQSLYAGPGFIKSPEPRMLPMPSPFMSRVSLVA